MKGSEARCECTALSASSDARKYVIEIPREVAEAARAKLSADMPKA